MKRPIAVVVISAALIGLPQVSSAQKSCQPAPSAYDKGGTPNENAIVNDPLFKHQWGLRQMNVPSAWKQGARGNGTVIAVIDSGVDLHHPDLRINLVEGIDLTEGSQGDCPGPQDDAGHGTHVAGIAAAVADNGIGIVGVAPKADIMPIKFLYPGDVEGPAGPYGSLAEVAKRVAEGIRYAVIHGADVINISSTLNLVPADIPGSGISEAIQFAWDEGALVVAAAANGERPWCDYPASDPLAVCVGATDRQGHKTSYSNDPFKPTSDWAVLAPGGNEAEEFDCESNNLIWSTYLASENDCGVRGYHTDGGSSMASPAVAGVAALLFGLGLDNSEVVDCLLKTSSNDGSYDRFTGYGIVNAGRAVARCT